MANNRIGKVDAWINIGVNEDALKKRITNLLHDTEEAVNKNILTIKFKVGEDGAVELAESLKRLNEEAANGIVFGFDKGAWEAMWKQLDSSGKQEMEKLRTMFESLFKGQNFFKGFDYNPLEEGTKGIAKQSAAVKELQDRLTGLRKQLKGAIGKDLSDAFSAFDSKESAANAKKVLAALENAKKIYGDISKFKTFGWTYGADNKLIDETSINRHQRAAIEIMSGGANTLKSTQQKSITESAGKLRDNWLGIYNEIVRLQQELKNTKSSGDATQVAITPANLEEFHQKIEEYSRNNPTKITITPANLEEFHTSIERYSASNPVKTSLEANLQDFYSKLEAYTQSTPINVIVNPTVPEGFSLDIKNANISGGNLTGGVNQGSSALSIGQIIKQFAEAEEIMQGRVKDWNKRTKKWKDNYTNTERSVFFNTETGYIGNTYVRGNDANVPYDLYQEQLRRDEGKVNAHLHTHPYLNDDNLNSGISVPTPSEGDLNVIARDLSRGITQQFIATMKEVIHLDFAGMTEDEAKKIGKEHKSSKPNAKRLVQNAKSSWFIDYFSDAFNNNEDIAKGYLNNGLSWVKSLGNFDDSTFSTFVDQVYQQLGKSLLDATNNFSKEAFDFEKMIDTKSLSDLWNKYFPNHDSSLFLDELEGSLYKTQSDNDVYNNEIFRSYVDSLREIFKNNGFDSDRIKTYTLDEFEKITSAQSSSGIRQQIQNSQVNVTLQASDADIAALKSKIEGILNPLSTTIEASNLSEFSQNIASHINANPIDVKIKPNINGELSSIIEQIKSGLVTTDDKIIDIKLDSNIEQLKTDIQSLDGQKINLDFNLGGANGNVSTSISSLVESIDGIKTAFNSVGENVEQNSTKQVASIKKITDAVDILVEKLKSIGVLTIGDLDKVMVSASKVLKGNLELKKKEQQLAQEIIKTEQQRIKLEQERQVLLKKQAEAEAAKINAANKELEAKKKLLDIENKKANLQAKKDKANQNNDEVIYDADEQTIIKELFEEAAANTSGIKIDQNSIKVANNGIVTFTAVIEEAGNKATIARYQIEEFENAILNTGQLDLDYLKNSSIGVSTKNLSDKNIKSKFAELAKEANLNIDEGSLKVSKGVITYTNTLRDGAKAIETYKNQIQSLDDILNSEGKLKADFVSSSNQGDTGFSVGELTKISAKATELQNVIKQIRTLENREGFSADENNAIYQKVKNLKEKEVQLENEIYASLEKQKISYQEIEKIEKRIQEARNGTLNSYEISESKLAKEKELYAEKMSQIDYDNLFADRNVKKVSKDGEITTITLKEAIESVRLEIDKYYNAITQGTATSSAEVDELTTKLRAQYELLDKLTLGENQIKNKKGIFETSFNLGQGLNNIDFNTIKEKVSNYFKDEKKYNQVNFGEYNLKKNSFDVELINGDKLVKATIYLSELKNEAGEAAIAIRALYEAEGKNQTFGQKWISGLKAKISNLTQYVTGIEIVMRAWREAKEGFNFVKELNTSMTTIYQTMDITTKGLDELSRKSIQASKALGAASEQMLDSVNIYAAYGKTVEEIINQAEPTVMLANAAQSSAEEASNQIQAVVQQYRELEGQETRIVNAYEKIAANVQIDFDKGIQSIAEGVQVAGTVANESGLSFEQFAASVAKVAERTRMEGSSIGNAYKTIMARVSRSKTGDEEASVEERGDAAKALSKVGINVYDESGAYQDFSVTLDMLAAKWDTLTDAQKANISEAMSGVRNINTMNAIIGTWTEAQQLANDTLEDTGYYLEVQDKWMDSMQAKLNTLTATTQEFWYNFYDVGAVNLLIDGLTTIVKIGEGVVNVFKSIGSVFGETGGQVGAIGGAAATVFAVASAWNSFNKKLSTTDENGVTTTYRGGIKSLWTDLKGLAKQAKDTWGVFKTGMAEATAGTPKLVGGITAVWSSVGKLGKAFIGLGAATAVIWALSLALKGLGASSKETSEAAEKANEAFQQNQQTLKNNKSTIDSVSKDYQSLSKGVDLDTNENISLTNDEYDRYLNICNQIAGMYPSLIKSYDEQGNAILKLKGNVSALNEEYEKQRVNAARANFDNADTYLLDFANQTKNRSEWTEFLDGGWDSLGAIFGIDSADIDKSITKKEALDGLEEALELSYSELRDKLSKGTGSGGFENMFLKSYLTSDEIGFSANMSLEKYYTALENAKNKIMLLQTDLNSEAAPVKQLMQDYITMLTAEGGALSGLDNNIIDQVRQAVSMSTTEQIEEFGKDKEKLKEYVQEWFSVLSNNSEAQTSLGNILGLSDDSSMEDIVHVVEKDLKVLSEVLDKDENKLKIQFELEDEIKLAEKYGKIVDSVSKKIKKQQKNITKETDKTNKKAKNLVDEYDELEYYSKQVKDYIKEQGINTASELNLLQDCVDTTDSWAEAMRKFELTNIADYEEIIENLKGNLTTVATNIENVNEAVTAANGSIGLSEEQIKNVVSAFEDLDGFDYDMLFESTASGVRLNAYELQKLNSEYEKTQKLKYEETLNDMGEKYEDLCVAITETEDAQEKLDLIARRNTLKDQIKEVQELASRYGGLTSAYTKWQNAQDTTNSHEMYDNIYSGLEEIDELYQRDLTGTDDFKTYMQQFFYGDLDEYLNKAGMSYEQFYKSKAAEIQKYFTKDNTGSVNFLNKLKEEGFATNENGQWLIDGDIEEIAERFKWATSSIDAQFKKLEAHEFKFRFVEKDPLEDLKVAAQEASSVITETFGDEYEFNFNTDNIDVVDGYINQLQSLKAQGGLTEEQIAALNKQVDYWTARKGDLTKAVEIDFDLNKSIAELEICADILEKLGKEVNINLNPSNASEARTEIEKAWTLLQGLLKEDGTLDLEVEGAEEALTILGNLIYSRKTLEDTAIIMDVDTSMIEGNMSSAIEKVKEYRLAVQELETINELNTEYNLNLDTSEVQKQVDAALTAVKGIDKDILTSLKLDTTSEEKLKESISAIDAQLLVEAGVNEEAIIGYKPENKTAEVVYDYSKTDAYNRFLNSNLDRSATVTYKYNTEGTPPSTAAKTYNNPFGLANGTAHANGTTLLQKGLAFAKGTWGAAKGGMSLVGELGRELVVRGNRFFTVGDNGAEFADIKKGDIVFNHKQTESLLENGYVTGRGHMVGDSYAEGNAYALVSALGLGGSPGRYTNNGYEPTNPSLNNTPTDNTSLLKDAADAADEFKEKIDWIEIWLDRIQRKIEDLDTIANSAYKSFGKRNSTLKEEFAAVTEEIRRQEAAYNKYMEYANQVDLSESYKQKVRNGTLQIETITDENLREKIEEYQELYEKALDCKSAIIESNERLGDIAKAKFDNVIEEFENLTAVIEDATSALETALDIVEAKGNFASKEYFEALIKTERETNATLREEYATLQSEFKEAMSTGAIEEGSAAWYEMKASIREVGLAIQESDLALIEFANDMREMDWSAFEYGQDLISKLTEESEFLIDLLSFNENDLFSKTSGKLTDEGFAVGGLHAVNYNTYMAQAEEYERKMKEVSKELAKDPTNTILIDKKNEYIAAQQEAIRNANDEKMAIKDLIEESYNRMLEVLQELIDKRKEALQAEKDLYDYEKNVAEQTKQIADYQKQLSALAGDDSEESKSKRQQLQTSLEDAQKNLEETEYDRWLSDQEKLMDDMYEDYETILNERLDNIDGLLADMIDATNTNAGTISDTINTAAGNVGYNVTDGMAGIWNTTESGVGKVVTDFSSNFTTTMTTTNSYIKSIRELISKIVAESDKEFIENTNPAGGGTGGSGGTGGGSGGGNKPTNTPSNTPTNNAPPKKKGWFFVYKKSQYPKSKLNIEQSIVDEIIVHPII